MFHDIPAGMATRMEALQQMDAADRVAGVAQMERLRQVPPETGRFLAILAAQTPPGRHIEIGTSAGYSAMWLSLACRAKGCGLLTFELLPAKAALARETIRLAEMGDVVTLVEGDARGHLAALEEIAFCFLDAEKEVYQECYELVVPRMVKGGLLIADNAISHREGLEQMIARALADTRVDAMVVGIGSGELICRRI